MPSATSRGKPHVAHSHPVRRLSAGRLRTLSGHFFGAAVLLCHQAAYAAWPAGVRQAVLEAASEATAAQRQFAAAEDEAVLARLCPAGNEVIRLTDAERALFVAAVAPVIGEQRQRFGDRLMSYLVSRPPR